MQEKNRVAGQWFGYFSYGPEYGPELEGEKVTFSLLIEELPSGQFRGKCIELKGIGANHEVSTINGFIENNFISFTKEYNTFKSIDEIGNEVDYKGSPPRLSYKGHFNSYSQTFGGSWEIWANEEPYGDGAFVDVCTGLWEIGREAAAYGV
jgi:hypothetical protein